MRRERVDEIFKCRRDLYPRQAPKNAAASRSDGMPHGYRVPKRLASSTPWRDFDIGRSRGHDAQWPTWFSEGAHGVASGREADRCAFARSAGAESARPAASQQRLGSQDDGARQLGWRLDEWVKVWMDLILKTE